MSYNELKKLETILEEEPHNFTRIFRNHVGQKKLTLRARVSILDVLEDNYEDTLIELDKSNINSTAYFGFAEFWNKDSKYSSLLKTLPFDARKKVHNRLILNHAIEFRETNKGVFSSEEERENFDRSVELEIGNLLCLQVANRKDK